MDWFIISNTIIPIAGMATGLMVISGLFRLGHKALDRRLPAQPDGETLARLEQLEDEMARLREENAAQLDDIQERLDFAERVLANPPKQ